MPIAGVIIQTDGNDNGQVLEQLQAFKNVYTYGVHKGNSIVAVFDCESSKELKGLADQITEQVQGVMGVYPAYVNYEDEMEQAQE